MLDAVDCDAVAVESQRKASRSQYRVPRMLDDTIFAIASPPGAAARGIVRISGPEALAAAGALVGPLPSERAALERSLQACGFPVECLVLVMPGPHSYTGEDVVELHMLGSPMLLEIVQSQLRAAAAGRLRDATPGEFTRRAFTHGRLDLAQAEAVLDLIAASGEQERRRAVHVLRGGLAEAIRSVRGSIQDAQALLEAGLDFTEGETGQVPPELWRPRLASAIAALTEMRAQLPRAAPGGELLLRGAANAGKSSLANALLGRAALLVSSEPGTTRDVIAVEVAPGVTLLDAPGDWDSDDEVGRAAIALRDRVGARAGAALLVVDLTAPVVPPNAGLPVAAVVLTKLDLVAVSVPPPGLPEVPVFAVSAATGAGLPALRTFLAARPRRGPVGRGRSADLLGQARDALEGALAASGDGAPDEVVALDLAQALAALDAIDGRSSPEDVLDRIFACFCLGK